jgi:hypothetical protein
LLESPILILENCEFINSNDNFQNLPKYFTAKNLELFPKMVQFLKTVSTKDNSATQEKQQKIKNYKCQHKDEEQPH